MSTFWLPIHPVGDAPARQPRRRWVGPTVLVAAIAVIGGCGGNPVASTTSGTGNPTTVIAGANDANAPAGGDVAAGEANTGEAPSVPFESPTHHYAIAAPGTMTEDPNGAATSHFGGEQLSITVVSGVGAADPATVAKADMAHAATSPNFKLTSGPTATRLGQAPTTLKAVYAATDGSNAVTGKPDDVVIVKYWVTKDASTLAVLTYRVTASQYDPQGADDIANTFRWL